MDIAKFQQTTWKFYKENARDLPWRHTNDPYKIIVSEIMLQQTQVSRVIPKYQEFLKQFPTVHALAGSELASVLKTWGGLGYNRRAKYLHQAAQKIMTDFNGKLPRTVEGLMQLPGVGKNTAGAILAYACNEPVVFIETNIRTVFIHHFFADKSKTSDTELLPLIAQTLDKDNPCQWYWALMDYGTYLKNTVGNVAQRSKHYTKQSAFQGSLRQIRGQVLRLLVDRAYSAKELKAEIVDARLQTVLQDLQTEKLITHSHGVYHLG